MNKPQLINSIAEKNDLEKSMVEKVINSFEQTVTNELKAGNDVALPGFGTFSARERSARMGVNPRNPSEKIHIPATTVAKFKVGKTLKDALKANRAVEVTETTEEE